MRRAALVGGSIVCLIIMAHFIAPHSVRPLLGVLGGFGIGLWAGGGDA
jgi:hypothetical protein